MAGRKRQPIELLMAKGNISHLTKEEIEKRKKLEVQAPVGEGYAPDYLTAKQKNIFEDYAKQLIALKVYSDLDRETLAFFVVASEEYKDYTKQIRKLSIATTDEEKKLRNLELRKLLAIERDRSYKQAKQSASELGLTITSRAKLIVPQVEEPEENKFAKFMKMG